MDGLSSGARKALRTSPVLRTDGLSEKWINLISQHCARDTLFAEPVTSGTEQTLTDSRLCTDMTHERKG